MSRSEYAKNVAPILVLENQALIIDALLILLRPHVTSLELQMKLAHNIGRTQSIVQMLREDAV